VRKGVVSMAVLTLALSGCAGSTALRKGAKTEQLTGEKIEENVVILQTSQGDISIKPMSETAPKACENFIGLVKKGYYDGIIFHRVIKGFMIQGGDPTGTGRGGSSLWSRPFEDEVDEEITFDRKGLIAMANAGPDSNGSQFFITTGSAPWLNMKHTIFGEIISGYDVVEKIENTAVDPRDRPIKQQIIIKAYVKK
jgi:peptidylprolyl isomerase